MGRQWREDRGRHDEREGVLQVRGYLVQRFRPGTSSLRLILFFKVVEGLVPAIPADKLTKQQKPGRLIRSSTDKNFLSSNTINSYIRNNDRCFVVHPCRTDQLRNSFFCRTVVEWNHLDNNIVHSASVNSFRTAISQ